MLHLMVVCFFALQNVDLLEEEKHGELNASGGEEEPVRRHRLSTDLVFGLQQGLQLLQGLGQLVLQQVTGALACVSLQISHLATQKLDTPGVREYCARPRMETKSFWSGLKAVHATPETHSKSQSLSCLVPLMFER